MEAPALFSGLCDISHQHLLHLCCRATGMFRDGEKCGKCGKLLQQRLMEFRWFTERCFQAHLRRPISHPPIHLLGETEGTCAWPQGLGAPTFQTLQVRCWKHNWERSPAFMRLEAVEVELCYARWNNKPLGCWSTRKAWREPALSSAPTSRQSGREC